MNNAAKMTKMEEILKLLDEGLTRNDFEESFRIVLDAIDKLRKDNGTEFDLMHQAITILSEKVRTDATDDLTGFKQEVSAIVQKALKEQSSGMNFIYDKVRRIKEGADGKNGNDGAPGAQGLAGQDAPIKTPQEIRDELETLEGDERLDKSAIKGIEEIEASVKEIQIRPTGRFGRSLLQLYVGGAKKGAVQYLNLVAGSGVTLTYASANGRNDVTISATGGAGALSVLAATGTIDDSNVTFTFVSTPTLVIVNGASYRNGHGCTITGTTVTLDNAVGVSGDIYALG